MFYWVNQGRTYHIEKKGGYLWAPYEDQNGDKQFHWENMDKLNPEDIVFNYYKGRLLGYSIVKSKAYESPRPTEFNHEIGWDKEGRLAEVEYFAFQPLQLDQIYNQISDLLPTKYSPVNKTKKGNQGYLFSISNQLGGVLLNLAGIDFHQDTVDNLANNDNLPDSTSRKGLTTNRVGQSDYRRKILNRWKYQCAVTKSPVVSILVASHILPWREANDYERLDVDNGILLSPIYDALFDKNYISFDNNGNIILSKTLDRKEYEILGITGNEKIDRLTEGNKKYLMTHRKKLIH